MSADEQVINYSEKDIEGLKNKFKKEIKNLFDAIVRYELTKTEFTEHKFHAARFEVENSIEQARQLITLIHNKENEVIHEIQTIQNENNSSKNEYKITEHKTNNELNYNLASFPLKSQTELKKRIIYLYLFLQLIGIFLTILILYIQSQSKPSSKIKPNKIRKKATNQIKNIYGTGLNYTDRYGRLAGNNFLDYANRGTVYGIKQGKRVSNNLSRFLFGDQVRN